MTCVQGITKTAISKMGMKASDTAILTFEDVRVPLANIVGEEGQGFTYQMLQFQVINISLSVWHRVTTASYLVALRSIDWLLQKGFGPLPFCITQGEGG